MAAGEEIGTSVTYVGPPVPSVDVRIASGGEIQVKGAMLIGNGPTDLNRITMIGNDFALDPGIGTCGKNGQGVPVGVGQPSLRMDKITVGGTA